MDFELEIKQLLKKETGLEKIILETPPNSELGDFAFPCFQLTKKLKKEAPEIAEELSKKIAKSLDQSEEEKPNFISEIKIVGPYLNFFVHIRMFILQICRILCKDLTCYLTLNI